MRTPHGIATIYDDLREHDVEVCAVHSWHVGGYNTQTYEWIKRKLRPALKNGELAADREIASIDCW